MKVFRSIKRNILNFCRMFRNMPMGNILHWLMTIKGSSLICLYALTYITLALIFAFIYIKTGNIWDTTIENYTTKFSDIIYFSFITQTNLGYGDLVPKNSAQLIVSLHTITAIIFTAIFLGVIVAKTINPRPKIFFTDKIAYDNDSHKINFWFWNRNACGFSNIKVSIVIKREVPRAKDPFLRFINYPLLLSKSSPPYLDTMTTVVLRTSSEGINNYNLPPTLDLKPNPISILSLKKNDEIILTVEVNSVDTGHYGALKKSYFLKDIKCGTFPHIMQKKAVKVSWHNISYHRFGFIVGTPIKQCARCCILENCPLEVASKCKKWLKAEKDNA